MNRAAVLCASELAGVAVLERVLESELTDTRVEARRDCTEQSCPLMLIKCDRALTKQR